MRDASRRRYWIVSAIVATLVAGFITLTACANYGEGERCESGNGNDDCVDGLQCTPSADLAPAFRGPDRCCPPDRSRATVESCQLPTGSIAGEAGAPPDTGPPMDAAGKDTSMPDTSPGTDAADAADADEGG